MAERNALYVDEYGRQLGEDAPVPGAVRNILDAARAGWNDTQFWTPEGRTWLDTLDPVSRKMLESNAGLVSSVLGAGNALYRGAQQAVVEGGNALDRAGVPQIPGTGTWSQAGRDFASLQDAFMGSPHSLPHVDVPGVVTQARAAVPGVVDATRAVLADESGAVKIPTLGGNVARVDVRGPGNVPQDVKPMTGREVGKLLDEHIAAGGIDLYGGRGTTGTDVMVTLPPGVTRASDIGARSQSMVDRAALMTQGVPEGAPQPRYWYEEGAQKLHDVTGRDFDATQRLTAAHAITSPQTDVAGNSNLAVNAWNQSLLGDPIAVKSAPQNKALEETLYGSSLPESRKVGPFFENHMRTLDPKIADNLTNDIWQMREAGYTGPKGEPYSGTPSVGEDNYNRLMVARATRRLNEQGVDGGGWTPNQVQAALWTHAKNLQEKGVATPDSFNFANAIERLTTGQADAHHGGPALLGDAAHDPQAQEGLRNLMMDPHGRDIVNSSLGMLTPSGVPGGAVVAITGDGIKPSSRALMDASTLTRATLLRQPSALWTAHPAVSGLPPIRDANVVHALSGSPEFLPALHAALDKAGGGLEHAVLQPSPSGVRVLNIGERTGLSNEAFQAAVKSATQKAGLSADMRRARADYGYYTHDWEADPTGRGYVAALSKLPPHLQRISDQLFAGLGGRIDAQASQISRGQGNTGPWRLPGFAEAVGPELELPLRQWVERPSPTGSGSALPGLLGVR